MGDYLSDKKVGKHVKLHLNGDITSEFFFINQNIY